MCIYYNSIPIQNLHQLIEKHSQLKMKENVELQMNTVALLLYLLICISSNQGLPHRLFQRPTTETRTNSR